MDDVVRRGRSVAHPFLLHGDDRIRGSVRRTGQTDKPRYPNGAVIRQVAGVAAVPVHNSANSLLLAPTLCSHCPVRSRSNVAFLTICPSR